MDQLATQGSDLTASHDRSWCGLGASQARGGGQGLLCLEQDDCNVDVHESDVGNNEDGVDICQAWVVDDLA